MMMRGIFVCIVTILLLCCLIGAFGQIAGNDSLIWNVVAKRKLTINPADAACISHRTYCLPTDSSRLPARTGVQTQQCLSAVCIPKDTLLSAVNDENLASLFVTRSLEQLEITANLNSSYDVFHLRLVFSGNPPAAISIERFTEGASAWVPWQYYAVDCIRSFGIPPDQPLATVNAIQCNTLPWAPNGSHRQDALYWNVFQGRPGATDVTKNPALRQFFSTTAVRVKLEGHLLPLQPGFTTTGTDYGWTTYRIAEISVYGRCGEKFYRSSTDPVPCLPCDCSLPGSVNGTCLPNGACFCKTSYQGAKCSECTAGFFDSSRGCMPCNCDAMGSTTNVCDNRNGTCLCKAGFTGSRCNECAAGMFLLDQMCAACDCSPAGSAPERCSRNGKCFCKRFVTGAKCDQCLEAFENLTSTNPNGCVLRPMVAPAVTHLPIAMSDSDHTISNRAVQPFPAMLALNGVAVANDNATTSGTAPTTSSQTVSRNDVLYPWLIAITALLIIALIILVIHLIYYIRRRKSHKAYSPRQIPEFLSAEANAHLHPDYANRHVPPKNAKLTGYFYNPEYPIGSLTPGVRERSVDVRNRQQNLEEEDEGADYGGPSNNYGRHDLDLSREPPTTGTFRPHTYHRSPLQRQDIATISGGIVNQNFDPADLRH